MTKQNPIITTMFQQHYPEWFLYLVACHDMAAIISVDCNDTKFRTYMIHTRTSLKQASAVIKMCLMCPCSIFKSKQRIKVFSKSFLCQHRGFTIVNCRFCFAVLIPKNSYLPFHLNTDRKENHVKFYFNNYWIRKYIRSKGRYKQKR